MNIMSFYSPDKDYYNAILLFRLVQNFNEIDKKINEKQ